MTKAEGYAVKAEEIVTPIAQSENCSVYDVEFVKEADTYYLRIFIDKDGGVSIDDCENVSRAYSKATDDNDFIAEAYILEVSSPGLGRALKKDRHFEKSIGLEVELKLFKPLEKQKEFSGVLLAFDKETLTIKTSGKDRTFERKQVASVKLALDI